MKKVLKEIWNRLKSPVVIGAIVLFILQVLVSSNIIKLGESEISKIAEMITSIITKVFIGFAILNDPSQRKKF